MLIRALCAARGVISVHYAARCILSTCSFYTSARKIALNNYFQFRDLKLYPFSEQVAL